MLFYIHCLITWIIVIKPSSSHNIHLKKKYNQKLILKTGGLNNIINTKTINSKTNNNNKIENFHSSPVSQGKKWDKFKDFWKTNLDFSKLFKNKSEIKPKASTRKYGKVQDWLGNIETPDLLAPPITVSDQDRAAGMDTDLSVLNQALNLNLNNRNFIDIFMNNSYIIDNALEAYRHQVGEHSYNEVNSRYLNLMSTITFIRYVETEREFPWRQDSILNDIRNQGLPYVHLPSLNENLLNQGGDQGSSSNGANLGGGGDQGSSSNGADLGGGGDVGGD